MMSWSTRRRVAYISIVITFFSVLIGSYLFIKLYEPPTCFDGKHNQAEAGIDCGGSCQYLCKSQVTSPVTLFTRSFKVSEGVYNSVAYVENPNFSAATQEFPYTFKLYDTKNQLITERSGSTYLTPGGVSPIFEATIRITDGREPARTFFEFSPDTNWRRVQGGIETELVVKNRELINEDTKPRVRAVLENTAVVPKKDLEIVTVVFNALGNAIAASRTFIDEIPKRSEQPLVFTWPEPFAKALEACVAPVDVLLLMDVSGSMNDDNADPPQPLTDAKTAAQDFINRLSTVDRSGLVAFASEARLVQSLTTGHAGTAAAIDLLVIDPKEETGSTNTGDALFDAIRELRRATPRQENRNLAAAEAIVVLLTDGKANAPDDPGGEEYALNAIANIEKDEMTVYTIGLGDGVNAAFLRELAGDRERYFPAEQSADLAGIYEQISDAICERGSARIEITPRTITDIVPVD